MAGHSSTFVTGPFYTRSPQLPGWVTMIATTEEVVAREAQSSVEHWLRVEQLPLPQSGMDQALPRLEVQGLPAANHSCILIPIPVHTTLAVMAGV